MVYQCDACKRVYELERTDVRCVYCGECRCHPVEMPPLAEENKE